MTTVSPGTYLLVHHGFDHDLAPQLTLSNEALTDLPLRGRHLTLIFDTRQRYCTGWHDLASHQNYICPESAETLKGFDQCRHCQLKTGFNPAFYHAKNVSPQQQTRNQEPHLLYLAHFAPGVVKVGITWAERGIRRLLDQGARSGIIIKTYPSADLARHYEAKIAQLPGIIETLQTRAKLQYLGREYDVAAAHKELSAGRQRLTTEIGITPDAHEPESFDAYYFADEKPTTSFVDLSAAAAISGRIIGMVGSVLFAGQAGTHFVLPLSRLSGYPLRLEYSTQTIEHPPQQVSLF